MTQQRVVPSLVWRPHHPNPAAVLEQSVSRAGGQRSRHASPCSLFCHHIKVHALCRSFWGVPSAEVLAPAGAWAFRPPCAYVASASQSSIAAVLHASAATRQPRGGGGGAHAGTHACRARPRAAHHRQTPQPPHTHTHAHAHEIANQRRYTQPSSAAAAAARPRYAAQRGAPRQPAHNSWPSRWAAVARACSG